MNIQYMTQRGLDLFTQTLGTHTDGWVAVCCLDMYDKLHAAAGAGGIALAQSGGLTVGPFRVHVVIAYPRDRIDIVREEEMPKFQLVAIA